jgi:hypothetical protein
MDDDLIDFCDDFCEDRPIPWWKIILLIWVFS